MGRAAAAAPARLHACLPTPGSHPSCLPPLSFLPAEPARAWPAHEEQCPHAEGCEICCCGWPGSEGADLMRLACSVLTFLGDCFSVLRPCQPLATTQAVMLHPYSPHRQGQAHRRQEGALILPRAAWAVGWRGTGERPCVRACMHACMFVSEATGASSWLCHPHQPGLPSIAAPCQPLTIRCRLAPCPPADRPQVSRPSDLTLRRRGYARGRGGGLLAPLPALSVSR